MDISLRHVGNMDLHIREPGAFNAIFQRISRIGKTCWIHHQPIESLVRATVNLVDRLAFQVCIENLKLEIPSFGIVQKCRVEFIRSGTPVNLRFSFAQIGKVCSLNKDDFFYFAQFPLSFGWFVEVADGPS